ncbi:RNA-binding protein 41 like protein [Argiope bruennichi]|uniref:RNA-binding protein 41 like protein n=1 Tax=Argiope bruennichi TaxID=94029 RepID=A0A8T0FQU4_ARGBR|nr:RNA-binding protein 41 like protein [Argiope bruennichi]
MARILYNKKASVVYLDDEVDVKNLGEETEAEKQMKVILEKQLKTQVSMKEQFSQHRTFVSPSTYKSPTELIEGACSVQEFQELEREEEMRQELQRCGLSEQEITDYLLFKLGKKNEERLVNPAVLKENIARIEEKIKAHNEELLKPQSFKNVKKLTRHEMEIEKALYAGCPEKRKLATLVFTEDTVEDSYTSVPFNYIKNLSEKLLQKVSKKRKKRLKLEEESVPESESGENENVQFDSNIHHVVVPLESSEVAEKKLSVEEIRKMPKFENYCIGQPNKTLYIKNLHAKTTEQELRSVFGRFEEENGTFINYRVCTGRMKGQAFIHFSDTKLAEKALYFANGFLIRGKPMIIEFGKKT